MVISKIVRVTSKTDLTYITIHVTFAAVHCSTVKIIGTIYNL